MKTTLTLSIILLFTLCIQSQTYSFSVSKSTYAELDGGTLAFNEPMWDDPEFTIPVEIDFSFFNKKVENLINFGDGVFATDSIDYESFNLLIPFASDLMDRSNDFNMGSPSTSLSEISYLVEGEVGSRIQKIEWNNVGFYSDISDNGVSTDFVNFQLWLYEDTGTIEIHFGEMSVTDPGLAYDGLEGPLVGLANELNENNEELGEFLYLSGSVDNPILIEADNIGDYYYNNLVGTPTSGSVYRFERTPVAVDDALPAQDKYSISPNPATDILNIDQNIDLSKIQSIEIYNANGQLVQTKNADSKTLNISNLPAGLFYLHIQDEDELSVQRFVKLNK